MKKELFTLLFSVVILILSSVAIQATFECEVDADCSGDEFEFCEGNQAVTQLFVCMDSYCVEGDTELIEDCDDFTDNFCDGTEWFHESATCEVGDGFAFCDEDVDSGDCDNGLFCDGEETCSAGDCFDGSTVVCDSPPGPEECYDTGVCNEETDQCNYDKFPDTDGPLTYGLDADPFFNNGIFNLSATTEDNCSVIETAEYFLGFVGTAKCGSVGTGNTIFPEDDQSFDLDKLLEDLFKENVTFLEHDGVNWVCVRGKDNESNWGNCECLFYQSDLIVPEEPIDVKINGVLNAEELLVCGEDPLLMAKVCDSQSEIQQGEYFIDATIPPLPPPFSGFFMNASESVIEGIFHCANISATIDLDGVDEGTHYMRLRGKDDKEWWGKITAFNVSFIKDTTPPKTEKEIHPADDISVECYGFEPEEADIFEKTDGLTDGCLYVKPGTEIWLSADDFNPDNEEDGGFNDLPGEYAGDTVIHFIVWYKENPGDDWEISQEGTSSINGTVHFTLTNDSYHLIEYWAVDGCEEEERHHFELDIVDSKSILTTKDNFMHRVFTRP